MSGREHEVAAAKLEMRLRMRQVRAAIPAAQRREAAELVCRSLPSVLDAAGAVISSYRPIGDELDPGPLEATVAARGHAITLPVMRGRDRPLVFRLWRPGDAMVERAWGIREPTEAAPEAEPDIVIVPLLAFDAAGFRLGYGGGFYDRTLAWLRSRRAVVAVGLAFSEQQVDAVPHLDYDQPLDLILTPAGPIPVPPRG